MKLPSTKPLTTRDLATLSVFTALSIWFYIGFYFPDSYLLSYGNMPRTIMWVLRIILPMLYVGAILLYVNFRRHKFGWRELGLLMGSLLLSVLACYGITDARYQRRFDRHIGEYHPYLQIMPSFDKRLDSAAQKGERIFCLGGSTTRFPDRSGRDWPSRVEEILRNNGVQNAEVYNLGMEWYTSLHTLINYETNLRKYRPNVILIMQSINDLLMNADFSYMSHGSFRDDYGHFYGPVYRLIDRRTLWRYLDDVVSGLWYAVPRKTVTTDRFPGLEVYERNIKTIIELAERDSTTVILMTEPTLMKRNMSEEELSAVGMIKVEAINDTMVWSSETVVNGMERYNNALRSIALTHKLSLIDLEKEIPKTLTYFRDEVHYQDTTFSIIAPFISSRLLEYIYSNKTPHFHLRTVNDPR